MPDEFCVPDGNDFSDTGPDIVDSDSFDVTSDSSVDDLSDIMTDSIDTSAPVLDDDFYHATPNSDIPILQEDGSVASLEEVMAANAETDSGPLDEVEPYVATPNSDIPILQEDGSVASLEEIMAANAETDSGPLDEVEPYVATPNSDIPIHQEDGSVASLEEIMAANAETDSGPLDEVEPYACVPIGPIPCDEVDSVLALDSGQHSAVEIGQHLVAVLQAVGFQRGRRLHLPHIFRCGLDDLIYLVLGGDPFWLVNILIAVGNAAGLSYLTQRRTVKLDTQPVSVNFVRLETLLSKDNCCFSEVASLRIFTVVVHIYFPSVVDKIKKRPSSY